MRRLLGLSVVLGNLSLAACIDSSGPILQNAQPLFGQELRLQFYTLRKGFADEPENKRRSNGTAHDILVSAVA